jgi:hypothetical protein
MIARRRRGVSGVRRRDHPRNARSSMESAEHEYAFEAREAGMGPSQAWWRLRVGGRVAAKGGEGRRVMGSRGRRNKEEPVQ